MMEKWYDKDKAEKIATRSLQNRWVLKKWTMRMTEEGKEMSSVEWNNRKIARAAAKSWRPFYQYYVNLQWKAVLYPNFK